MLINAANLKKVSEGLSKVFNNALEATNGDYEKIATIVKANTITMNYAWLADTPRMREWIGDRVLKDLKAHTYAITKKDWESTVEVDRDDIRYDNLGIVKPRIQMMAEDAISHYDELTFGLLEANGNCYDSKPFFDNAHPVGSQTFSNKGTKKLTQRAFLDARAEMRGITSEHGRPLRIRPNLLIVPPELEEKAIEILVKERLTGGEENITKGMCDYLVVDYLTDPDAWYLLDTTKSLKPFILQKNTEIQFVSMDKEDDENVFMRKKFRFGTDAEHNGGYGLWQMAYMSDGTQA